MILIETNRTVIRAFNQGDWGDVHTLANDWSKAPGPAFDKWPTDEPGTKGMLALFIKNSGQYHALCLRESKKVIGLISLIIDDKNHGEIGHVILGKYQDNSIDREALQAIADYAFNAKGALSIVTNNAPEHKEQVAPLISLGFRNVDPANSGELAITKAEWEKSKKTANQCDK